MTEIRTGGLILMWLGLLLGGCGPKNESPQLQSLLKSAKSKPASELVAMAFDPNSADRRREGITALSSRSWGLEEPYLKGYATLLSSDDDAMVRSAAVRALGKAGVMKYQPEVIAALNDPSAAVRWDAAVALDSLPGEEAIAPLCRHAESDEAMDVRASSARALRHYRTPETIAALKDALDDREFTVRYQARQSLISLVGYDYGYYPQDWPDDVLTRTPPGQADPQSRWWDKFNLRKRWQARKAARRESGAAEPESNPPSPQ